MDNVLDVLLFLFENYLEEEIEGREVDHALRDELEGVGFPKEAIDHAFDWLEGLEDRRRNPDAAPSLGTIRVYAPDEQRKLSAACRGFIIHLEQLGILQPQQRELVIERLLALDERVDTDVIEVDHVKWTVLMVLFDQPGQEDAYARMEDMVFEIQADMLH